MFEHFSLKETLTTTMVLFAVIDIVGSLPIVVGLKQKFGRIDSEKSALVAGSIMLAFLFIGNKILKFIGVDVNSFAIAGAFVIFIIALEMILGIEIHKNTEPKAASIVPIAFPLVAGAGTLTTLLSLRANYHDINIIAAILLNTLFCLFGPKIGQLAGTKIRSNYAQVLQKVFGIVLLAISIKLFTANFAQLFTTYIKF